MSPMTATLSFKEEALLAISRLPNEADSATVREEIEILAALRQAEADSAAGRVVSQEEVERRFREWQKS